MLRLDEDAALPGLLPKEREARRNALAMLEQVLTARGSLEEEAARRLVRITALFGLEDREHGADETAAPEPSAAPETRSPGKSGAAASAARRTSRRPAGPQVRH
jgi:hypothetical protein